jgi:hypothetical protein
MLVLNVFAQSNCNEKALRISYLQARKDQYLPAIKTLEESLITNTKCADAMDRLAELYYRTNQRDAYLQAILRCINTNEEKGMSALFGLEKVMQSYQEKEESVLMMKYVYAKANLSEKNRKNIETVCMQYDKQKALEKNTVVDDVKNLGSVINTKLNQTFPSLTLDANTLVFTSNVNTLNEDFMISTYDTCTGWKLAENIGYPPNTSNPERSARISADGYYLFFTRCDMHSENGYDGGGCDIIYCYRENDSTWSSPQRFGATINSPDYEGEPCISSDNKIMYFVSDRAGGYGGKDIWKSKFEKGYWQVPINLGAQINTAGNETSPFIHPDNETFYFISNGHEGIGGSDAWMSKQKGDTTFTIPINLGYPINTNVDENSICISANGKFGLIARASVPEKNNIDIFQFNTYPAIRAKETHCIKGKIFDKKTKNGLTKYRMHLYDSAMNLLKTFSSNEGDASFAFPLLHGDKYILKVNEDELYNLFITTIDLQKPNLPANIDLPIRMKQMNELDTIYTYKINSQLEVDTNLCFIKNKMSSWKMYEEDSLQIQIVIQQNDYIDTSMCDKVCFSDAGKIEFDHYIDSMRTVRQNELITYFTWYQKYLQWAGFAKNEIIMKIEKVYWKAEKLYTIDASIIEKY